MELLMAMMANISSDVRASTSEKLHTRTISIGTCENHTAGRRLARHHALARFLVAGDKGIERYATNGGFRLFLYSLFRLGGTIPMSQHKTSFFNLLLEFFVAVCTADTAVAIVEGFFVDVSLNLFKQILYVFLDAFARASLSPMCRDA